MPIFEYPIDVQWSGGRDGHGVAKFVDSGTEVPIAVPVEFQGPGGASNPEELLAAAVAGCYAITFGIVAANKKLPVVRLDVRTVGAVEQTGPVTAYKSIVIRPTIVLASSATEDQVASAADLAMKADHYCLVTNAVRGKVEVTVEPTVVKE